jgi:hypothetical protein
VRQLDDIGKLHLFCALRSLPVSETSTTLCGELEKNSDYPSSITVGIFPLLPDSHRTRSLPYDIGMCSVIQSPLPTSRNGSSCDVRQLGSGSSFRSVLYAHSQLQRLLLHPAGNFSYVTSIAVGIFLLIPAFLALSSKKKKILMPIVTDIIPMDGSWP